ncbi:MAG: signal peptide peptidase SppA, partial [Rubrivivax sp.]
GLVDRTGSFADALAAAAKRAGLSDEHRTVYLEQQPGRVERLLSWLGAGVLTALDGSLGFDAGSTLLPGLPGDTLRGMQADLAALLAPGTRQQPFAASAHCLCSAP